MKKNALKILILVSAMGILASCGSSSKKSSGNGNGTCKVGGPSCAIENTSYNTNYYAK